MLVLAERSHFLLHAVVGSIPAGLKAAVATGGMTCETVVDAATEDALEVATVWAQATAAMEAPRRMVDSMMTVEATVESDCECQMSMDAFSTW